METTLKNISKTKNGPRNFSKINDNKIPSDESMQCSNDYKIYPVFGFGKNKVESFMNNTELKSKYSYIPKKDFLRLTQGVFPQVYILEDGRIMSIMNKRIFLKENL